MSGQHQQLTHSVSAGPAAAYRAARQLPSGGPAYAVFIATGTQR
ncbi:hypothetical protein [Streptomyces noursei]|nr:hypothetical protein [Streptomyces noursei]MCZ1018942.1 hypothetical protein [Streptomyces noursei]